MGGRFLRRAKKGNVKLVRLGLLSRLWLVGAALLILEGSIRAQTPGGELKKVRLGVPSISASGMPHFVARELGYYREEGFDPEIILMSGAISVQALVAGGVDYTGTPGVSIAAAVQGLKVVILMAYNDRPHYDLVVRPEISSYADLKGKVFGVSALSGFAYEIPRVMLSRNGLDLKKDVTIFVIGTPRDRLAALRANAVQATLLQPPFNFMAYNEGLRKLGYGGDYFQTVFGALTTSERKIKAEPDEVKRLVRATARGFVTFRSQREVAIPIMRRLLKLADQKLAEQIYEYSRSTMPPDATISEELMRTIIETQRQSAGVTRPVAPEEVFNFSFVRAAMKELASR